MLLLLAFTGTVNWFVTVELSTVTQLVPSP
jgi:hypothetical protein